MTQLLAGARGRAVRRPAAHRGARYRLRARYGDSVVELEDPYRFPPVLSDFDLYLLGEGTHLRLYDKLGAHPMELDGVRGRRLRGVRARVRAASAWSAISISGTAGATPCGCAATASGRSSFRASRAGDKYKYEIVSERRRAAAAQVRSGRIRGRAAAEHRLDRRRHGERCRGRRPRPPAPMRWRRRSRSTRCISARGGAGPRRATAGSPIASSPRRCRPMCAISASRMSSSCRSASIRSTARGATSRPACSRRPAASARRPISPLWSMPATARASRSFSTGCRDIFPTIRTGSASSTAPRSTSMPIRARAAISTGTR